MKPATMLWASVKLRLCQAQRCRDELQAHARTAQALKSLLRSHAKKGKPLPTAQLKKELAKVEMSASKVASCGIKRCNKQAQEAMHVTDRYCAVSKTPSKHPPALAAMCDALKRCRQTDLEARQTCVRKRVFTTLGRRLATPKGTLK